MRVGSHRRENGSRRTNPLPTSKRSPSSSRRPRASSSISIFSHQDHCTTFSHIFSRFSVSEHPFEPSDSVLSLFDPRPPSPSLPLGLFVLYHLIVNFVLYLLTFELFLMSISQMSSFHVHFHIFFFFLFTFTDFRLS